ncbi:hypothetical protein QCA50_003380 [Cerrena zonata]|uniref:Uncharacterized protein n=1 Tax=Cerrena zonata TaxID=2478898 RepID=A0AAW0GJJ2_9APHY
MSIVLCHFLLSLRSAYISSSDDAELASYVQFAASLVVNMSVPERPAENREIDFIDHYDHSPSPTVAPADGNAIAGPSRLGVDSSQPNVSTVSGPRATGGNSEEIV